MLCFFPPKLLALHSKRNQGSHVACWGVELGSTRSLAFQGFVHIFVLSGNKRSMFLNVRTATNRVSTYSWRLFPAVDLLVGILSFFFVAVRESKARSCMWSISFWGHFLGYRGNHQVTKCSHMDDSLWYRRVTIHSTQNNKPAERSHAIFSSAAVRLSGEFVQSATATASASWLVRWHRCFFLLPFCFLLFVYRIATGLWDKELYPPTFVIQGNLPLCVGGLFLGSPFCCIAEVVISRTPPKRSGFPLASPLKPTKKDTSKKTPPFLGVGGHPALFLWDGWFF